MDIVLIGAGRLASSLGPALCDAGHRIVCVYSRTLSAASQLAELLGSIPVTKPDELPLTADAFIFSVKDSALPHLAELVAKGRQEQLFLHTAGSIPMSVFPACIKRRGVLYPMQTFSKEQRVSFHDLPLFVESSDENTAQLLNTLATSISSRVFPMDSNRRKYLHLAAVFACNFVNHCYALSADILQQCGLPFDVMLPLTDETARKVHHLPPLQAQTGPAVRYDENVIGMQHDLLDGNPSMQQVYDILSESIHEKAITQ